MAEVVKSFRDLQVWREAIDLVELVYRALATFPADERFGLTSQFRRSSVSVPSNIAEGHARPTTRDYLRFLGISLGSLAEMETQLLISHRLGYLDDAALDPIAQSSTRIGRMLRTLMKSLQAKLPAP
ncbi:four helix bundle protein [Luteimonas soli]|uniref:Four helix bundle protein n=1 Tax=Luteimonas soli TaxID=1648966 RepID=A0ABV7XFF1_9GAMM